MRSTDAATSVAPERWRLIVDPPANGFWNMAVDEALLEAQLGEAPSPPTLRLYRWLPTLSLGRHQPLRSIRGPVLRSEGVRLVRRPTGGLAVLHDDEWTYAVAAPLGGALPPGVVATYGRIAEALAEMLLDLGLAVDPPDPDLSRTPAPHDAPEEAHCFAWRTAHEITVGGRKVLGSAQRRRRGAVLQHGSLPITLDRGAVGRYLEGADAPLAGRESFADLQELLGRRPDEDEVVAAFRSAFTRRLGIEFDLDTLRADERQRAVELYSWKYVSIDWTARGAIGWREARWGPRWVP